MKIPNSVPMTALEARDVTDILRQIEELGNRLQQRWNKAASDRKLPKGTLGRPDLSSCRWVLGKKEE